MNEQFNPRTGEIREKEVTILTGKRADGSTFYDLDFTGCPSKTEPHHAKDTDINYLVAKYKPDELAAYLAARGANKQPIYHDFSIEPDRETALNVMYRLKKHFETLPENAQRFFGTPMEFLKFIDNPDNISALQQMGLIKQNDLNETNTQAQNTSTSNKSTTVTSNNIDNNNSAPQGAT